MQARMRSLARRAIVALVAASTLLAAGAAQANTVWYAGPGPTGRPTTLEVTVDEDGTAYGRVFQSPAQAGEAVGLDVTFEGRATREEGRVRIDAIAVGNGLDRDGSALRVVADAVPSRRGGVAEPDPFGIALLTIVPAEGPVWRVSLPAIAVGVHARTSLDDGSLEVSAFGPFFYAEPWSYLEVAPDPFDLAESVATGLDQRAELGDTASGLWWDERTVEIGALTPRITSVRLTFDAYTGGAHPNTWYAFATWLRSDDEWRSADVCGVLRALAYRCDPPALRTAIVDALRAQEAAWVVEGSVNDRTPWLLDPFTVTGAGLQFDFAPYDVGPYAQGPFQVVLPFRGLPVR
jgi:hypothetical protein